VRGTMVIRPYGYAIWERIQSGIDERIKEAGAQNAYFPLFIPRATSRVRRSTSRASVRSWRCDLRRRRGTGRAGGRAPDVRNGDRRVHGQVDPELPDLPLLLNQWANVVRWELRPRLFCVRRSFCAGGHTAHASSEDASQYVKMIHATSTTISGQGARHTHVPGIKRRASGSRGHQLHDRRGMMRDGKALQLATSHELGQNFARAFDIYFQNEEGQAALCHTTSWGSSTRIVGGLIMAHGDDRAWCCAQPGPTQAVVIAVRDEAEVNEACKRAARDLKASACGSWSIARGSFGRRVTDWEIKGVPLRVEVGPRDLAQGS